MDKIGGMSVEFREGPLENEGVSSQKHRIADYLRPKRWQFVARVFFRPSLYLVGNTFGTGCAMNTPPDGDRVSFLVGIAYSLKFLGRH